MLAAITAAVGFLIAVLWFDLMFDVQVWPHRRADLLPEPVTESIATYYRRVGDRVVFTHTEVDDAYGGRGIGSALARGALDAVRAHGERVVPLCPFIAAYIDRHPDVADLIDEALTAQLRAGG